MDDRHSIVGILNSLEGRDSVEVLSSYIGEAVPRDDLSYQLSLEDSKVKLSERLLNFYHSIGECRIEWQCDLKKHKRIKKFRPGDSIVAGRIHVRPLEEMLLFDKKLEAEWWTKNLSEEERAELRKFRYLDFNDDYCRVGFIMKGKAIRDDKLYLIAQESEGFYPVDLSFDEYLKKWETYKGYQGWQYNYLFQNTENYRRMEHYLAQLFPE
jgi:hypothetical protein